MQQRRLHSKAGEYADGKAASYCYDFTGGWLFYRWQYKLYAIYCIATALGVDEKELYLWKVVPVQQKDQRQKQDRQQVNQGSKRTKQAAGVRHIEHLKLFADLQTYIGQRRRKSAGDRKNNR